MKIVSSLSRLCLGLTFGLVFAVLQAQAGYLYVINDAVAGNNIYGFSVNETTGELMLLKGFPVATGFAGAGLTNLRMITTDAANKRLYVVNRGSSNVSAYSINQSTGAITPLPFSPISVVANPRTIDVHPSGSPLIVGGDGISSFAIAAKTATAAVGSPYTLETGVSPAGSIMSVDGSYYYTGGNTGNFISGYAVDSGSGSLSPLPGSPFDTGNQTPNPTATDATGRLFVINSRQALTRVFRLVSGVPTAVTGSPFANGMSSFASLGVVHPNGNFLVLGDRTNNRVSVYSIAGSGADTTLSTVSGSPFATGGTVSSTLLLNQSGDFLFVANGSSRNISTFALDSTTGVLSNRVVGDVNTLGATGNLNGIAYVNFASPGVEVGISGRITANGRGLAHATVIISGPGGFSKIAPTSSFGYYSLSGILTGQAYTVSVISKFGTFTSQDVNVTGEITDLNFNAQ